MTLLGVPSEKKKRNLEGSSVNGNHPQSKKQQQVLAPQTATSSSSSTKNNANRRNGDSKVPFHIVPSSSKNHRSASGTSSTSSSENLPVHAYKAELLESILSDSSHVTLVVAETGSGKSTQIPAYLLHSPHRIVVTQPRRVAAITLATRVAKEHSIRLGGQVGYRVRFDDCSNADTQLLFATDGMLLREATIDPYLNRYSVVFLDEAHERSLQTDVLLGIVQRARKHRETSSSRPLKVVVMSATLDAPAFQTFFQQTNIVRIPGRQFAVQILYTSKPVDDYVEATLSTIAKIHDTEPDGDVLAFLPGQEEIEDVASLLRRHWDDDNEQDDRVQWTGDQVIKFQKSSSHKGEESSHQLVHGVLICQLYAALPPAAQLAAFAPKPPGCNRKVILATNIAETSVTLPSIRYVVDCGKHKSRRVLPTGMETLRVEDISQAQANQRAGRAGRVQDGWCFRLYTEPTFRDELDPTSVPDILRVNLAQVVLQLLGMGVADPLTFDFLTPPDTDSVQRALKLLHALAALDDDGVLTDYGRQLAKLPLDPVFGHLLLQSATYGCLSEMLTAVSVLSSENLFYRPAGNGGLTEGSLSGKASQAHRRFVSHEGDLPTFLNVYQAWRQEAAFEPAGRRRKPSKGPVHAVTTGGTPRLSHGDWCQRNFVSGRSLVRAYHIREQLETLCSRPVKQNGLGLDPITSSCGSDREAFLRCAAAGLFLQAASRIKATAESNGGAASKGRSGVLSSPSTARGRYRTKAGNATVSIHPTSSLFGRHPAPACVVYTELVTTTKTYIRGVTQIREEWLHEVAPTMYPK